MKENSFQRNVTTGNTEVTKKSLIAKNLNDVFINIVPKPAFIIPNSTKTFQTFLPKIINTVLNGTELTEKEFPNAFQSLKNDKSPGLENYM